MEEIQKIKWRSYDPSRILVPEWKPLNGADLRWLNLAAPSCGLYQLDAGDAVRIHFLTTGIVQRHLVTISFIPLRDRLRKQHCDNRGHGAGCVRSSIISTNSASLTAR